MGPRPQGSRRQAVFIAEVKSNTQNRARTPGSGRFCTGDRGSAAPPTANASGTPAAIRPAWGGGSGDVTDRGVGAIGALAALGFVVTFVEPPTAELSCRPVATGTLELVVAVMTLAALEASGTRSPLCGEAA